MANEVCICKQVCGISFFFQHQKLTHVYIKPNLNTILCEIKFGLMLNTPQASTCYVNY